jgi:enoyl-CoA hydratase/carnithine racemase
MFCYRFTADNDSMWLELRAIVEEISASDARVIVLSSTSEKFFTAGLDRIYPASDGTKLIYSESD